MATDKKWPGTVRYQDILEEYVDKYGVLVCENPKKMNPDEKTKAEVFKIGKECDGTG